MYTRVSTLSLPHVQMFVTVQKLNAMTHGPSPGYP